MYTADEARKKIEFEWERIEDHIDDCLSRYFVGKELKIHLDEWPENILTDVLDKYRDNGWIVRTEVIGKGIGSRPEIESAYFSLPIEEGK